MMAIDDSFLPLPQPGPRPKRPRGRPKGYPFVEREGPITVEDLRRPPPPKTSTVPIIRMSKVSE